MLTSLMFIFGLAFLQPLFHPFDRKRIGWLLALLPLSLFLYFYGFYGESTSGILIQESYEWVPILGLRLSFFLDHLSLMFVLLITGIGALILIFSGAYLGDHTDLSHFFAYLLLFMGSMLGLVLANNLILLFIFWELTSFSSYLLIGFHHERKAAREAALQAFVITTLGGLAMLVGVILIGDVVGSYELTDILSQKDTLLSDHRYPLLLCLIAFGCFTKSAQFPFHFWLPGAMQAPTPVSAYLHSATMVNAGIYLMVRLSPALGSTELWFWLLVPIGGFTMVFGAWTALFKTDLKLILAYSTISVLGMLFFQLGLGSGLAINGMMLLLICHALYKAALFMVAGAVDHEQGTREIDQLKGLAKKMPLTALAAVLAAMSYAGLPPLLGFWAKEGLYRSQLEAGWPFLLVGMFANMLLFASALLVGVYPFFRGFRAAKGPVKITEFALYLGPLCLGFLGLWLGLAPGGLVKYLLEPASRFVSSSAGSMLAGDYHLSFELALSLVTYLGGFLLFWYRAGLIKSGRELDVFEVVSPQRLYQQGFLHFKKFAPWLTEHLQNGYLRFYLFVMFSAVLVMEGWAFMLSPTDITLDFSGVRYWEWALTGLIIGASIATLFVRRFLFAILSLSVVGVGVVLIFALYNAPDLAITLALVEAQTLVLLVFLLSHLPRYSAVSGKWVKLRDGLLSAAFGALITGILLKIKNQNLFESISGYFTQNSMDLAHGKNIVNVILVDFRGLDTLGEITVLMVAGIGVFSLIKLKIK